MPKSKTCIPYHQALVVEKNKMSRLLDVHYKSDLFGLMHWISCDHPHYPMM